VFTLIKYATYLISCPLADNGTYNHLKPHFEMYDFSGCIVLFHLLLNIVNMGNTKQNKATKKKEGCCSLFIAYHSTPVLIERGARVGGGHRAAFLET